MDLQNEKIIRIPDGTGWVHAAHAWFPSVDRNGQPVLKSLVSSTQWPPGKIMKAACLVAWLEAQQGAGGPVLISRQQTPEPCERPPGRECKCGYWGMKGIETFEDGRPSMPQMFTDCVFGTVELSGRIIEGELGYKAELCRVTGLVLYRSSWKTTGIPADILPFYAQIARLAERYHVPVFKRWPLDGQGKILDRRTSMLYSVRDEEWLDIENLVEEEGT